MLDDVLDIVKITGEWTNKPKQKRIGTVKNSNGVIPCIINIPTVPLLHYLVSVVADGDIEIFVPFVFLAH